MTDQVYLKCRGKNFACFLYSCSMLGAKVIANLKPSCFEILRAADNKVSLRFSFKISDKANPIAFFVPARAAGFAPYSKKNPDMHFISLTYSMKPPDDLIELLGQMLEANVNARRRKEERIVITPESLRGIGLDTKETHVYIDSIPRKCIVRDLSFGSGQKGHLIPGHSFRRGRSAGCI